MHHITNSKGGTEFASNLRNLGTVDIVNVLLLQLRVVVDLSIGMHG